MELVWSLLIVAGATAIVLHLGRLAQRRPLPVSALDYINTQLMYQVLLFGVAILVLLVLRLIDAPVLGAFLTPGNIAAPASQVRWLGIREGESWLTLGPSLTFFITLATFLFIYRQFRSFAPALRRLTPLLPWVLLFSLGNSFSEEVIYRLGVVVPLAGTMEPAHILLISAIAFGLPHLRGMPNGIVGAIMAGLLGWLLAKSVVETGGLFWAWFIHFLQDIVIFSALVLAAATRSTTPPSATPDTR